jgi:hypothetical protein
VCFIGREEVRVVDWVTVFEKLVIMLINEVFTVFCQQCFAYILDRDWETHKYNFTFYQNAAAVVCLSKMHRSIFEKNLNLSNLQHINCSMWSDEDLDLIQSLNAVEKNDKYAVIESSNAIKKTAETVMFCQRANLPFDLIKAPNHHDFLRILTQYKGLVFRTGHPEPTPRVAVEAKMLNCKFLSQKEVIGVAHEDWFPLNGDELIAEVRKMRDEACIKLVGWLR